jgi:putative transposase
MAALVVPASTHENRASELMLEHLGRQGVTAGSSWSWWTEGSRPLRPALSVATTTSRSAGSGGTTSSPPSGPSGTPGESRSPTARIGRSRRLAKSFENTTTSATRWLQVACIAITLRHLSREEARRRPAAFAA